MNRATNKRIGIIKPVMFLVLAAMQIVLYVNIIGAIIAAWQEQILLIPALLAVFVVNVVPVMFSIVARQSNPNIKLSWLVFVLAFPLVGGIWHEIFGGGLFARRVRNTYSAQFGKNLDFLEQGPKVLEELADSDSAVLGQAYTVLNTSGFPVYKSTRTSLFQNGDDFLQILFDELTKAKKFILIECGALCTGDVYNGVFDILERKAQEELEIKIIYDKKSSGSSLPRGFRQSCQGVGIHARGFGALGTERDNRLMIVIDGNVAFCSTSSSLSDNLLRGGSTMFVLRGDAVWSCSVLFMNMWDAITKSSSDYAPYRPTLTYHEEHGYAAVFGDSPANELHPIRTVYLKMISSANSYVYIQTPNLQLDEVLSHSLKLAAASGVDVRLITSALTAHPLDGQSTRAYYAQLLASGVKIYEYEGTLNSKSLICDDTACLITTANLDYSSLLRNHELAVWLSADESVFETKDDFMAILQNSHEITSKTWRKHAKGLRKAWYAVLRALAPVV